MIIKTLAELQEADEAVAEGTRQTFEQLREICAYGVLSYPIYTITADQGLLVFEQALRDRFIEFHKGTVTFIHGSTGQDRDVKAEKYEDVSAFLRRRAAQHDRSPGQVQAVGQVRPPAGDQPDPPQLTQAAALGGDPASEAARILDPRHPGNVAGVRGPLSSVAAHLTWPSPRGAGRAAPIIASQ